MPAVAVTVKKLVWLQLYPFLCKFAQPYIQCVADFFKNGSVYVLDCEAGLWRCTHADLPPSRSRLWLRLRLQTVGHAHVPQSASSLPSLSIDEGKTFTVIIVASSVRVTLCWLLVCFGVFYDCSFSFGWLLSSLTQVYLWKLTCLLLMYTVFFTFTVVPHRSFTFCVISSDISGSRPWHCLERVFMLCVHTFPNSVTLYHGGTRTT